MHYHLQRMVITSLPAEEDPSFTDTPKAPLPVLHQPGFKALRPSQNSSLQVDHPWVPGWQPTSADMDPPPALLHTATTKTPLKSHQSPMHHRIMSPLLRMLPGPEERAVWKEQLIQFINEFINVITSGIVVCEC